MSGGIDLFVFHHDEYERLYNCTFYDVERVPLEKRTHPLVGLAFIILFLFFETMYIPTLYVMRQQRFLKHACYKIMYCMGIADVFCMWINGFFTGYFGMLGYVFCSSPTLIYWLGVCGTSIWVFQSDLGMVLALNRCIEIYSPFLGERFFKGKRTLIWIAFVCTHTLLFAYFTKPVLYTGLHVSWFFNPHTGYYDDFGSIYYNVPHSVHNIMVVVVLFSCYFVFLILLFRKSHMMSSTANRTSNTERQSFIQVFLICLINATAAAIYIYMQFFAVAEIVILIGQFCWLLAHGSPSFIYLSLNKSIQHRIMTVFSKTRIMTTANSSTANGQTTVSAIKTSTR